VYSTYVAYRASVLWCNGVFVCTVQVTSYWLPLVKQCTTGVSKPIILAGNKVCSAESVCVYVCVCVCVCAPEKDPVGVNCSGQLCVSKQASQLANEERYSPCMRQQVNTNRVDCLPGHTSCHIYHSINGLGLADEPQQGC